MTSSSESLSLLEMLRQNKVTIDSLSAAERKQMVIEHQSEFPIKVRPKIAARVANPTDPSDFLRSVYYDAMCFIDTLDEYCLDRLVHREGPWTWTGPDRRVDSVEEMELMIRLFPNFLQLSCHWKGLLAWSNAVHFLPLLWKLQKELIPSNLLPTNNKNVLSCHVYTLLTNDFENESYLYSLRCNVEKHYVEDKQYGRESLLVLERMRKEGLLGDYSVVFDKVHHLFGVTGYFPSLPFIEERVRLMVQWDTSIIKRLWIHLTEPPCWFSFTDSDWLSLFRMIFELGMTHFPMKLGFFFHGAHHRKLEFLVRCSYHYPLQSSLYNSAIQEIIPRYLHQGVTLRSLTLAAAVDDDISLTGLYTLISMDPSQLIFVSAAKSKKRKLSAIHASAKSF